MSTKKILLVEDHGDFREAIKEQLESLDFQVTSVENGELAKVEIKKIEFDLILSDVQMPQASGIELARWIRKVYDTQVSRSVELPIILMSGFNQMLKSAEVKKLGLKNLLNKPFGRSDLQEIIQQAIHFQNKDQDCRENESEDEIIAIEVPDYCKVSLEDFVTDREIKMDVFVKLSEVKYIKIVHKGGRIDIDRIESYKKKGLTHLYVRREDFRKVLDFNVRLSKVVLESDKVSREKKKRFIFHTAEVVMENTFVNGVDKQSLSDAQDFVMTSMDILTDDSESLGLLELLSNHADFIYAHSLGVSVYSTMIARKMGWSSSANLFKLSFGALMHDIGKKEFPKALLEKPRPLLTYNERVHLETHVFRGKEILEALKSAPSEVIQIAYQHHENILGQGYPRQLLGKQIHPMAKIVAVADAFCCYALKGPNNPGVTAEKAMYLMEAYKKDQLDPECFGALKAVVTN